MKYIVSQVNHPPNVVVVKNLYNYLVNGFDIFIFIAFGTLSIIKMINYLSICRIQIKIIIRILDVQLA